MASALFDAVSNRYNKMNGENQFDDEDSMSFGPMGQDKASAMMKALQKRDEYGMKPDIREASKEVFKEDE